MKFRTALLAATILVAGSALAQTAPTGTPQQPPIHHEPGVPAQPPQATMPTPGAVTEEKVDPAKEAAIRHLMDITETSKLGDNMSAFITSQVRSAASRTIQPENLQKFMDTFTEKFRASAPPSAVTDAMVPIYARAFSLEDIQALVSFYESPLGQRTVKALPGVIEESQNVGVEIDRKVAISVLRDMSTDYPELKRLLPPEHPQTPAAPDETPAPSTGAAPEKAPTRGSSSAPSPAPKPSSATPQK
ncbi:MAG TPA: DUF2059 domain-containing protein [Candidatus Polarisedimenticolia bacterium]|nr:DUF2059 domain-containing protein [Candidatus Polarisedimenticolia bacterium]